MVADGAIVYAELDGATSLSNGGPPGRRHVPAERRDDEARFGLCGRAGIVEQFLPPQILLWRARRNRDNEFDVEEEPGR